MNVGSFISALALGFVAGAIAGALNLEVEKDRLGTVLDEIHPLGAAS